MTTIICRQHPIHDEPTRACRFIFALRLQRGRRSYVRPANARQPRFRRTSRSADAKAITDLDGTQLNGRKLHVEAARPERPKAEVEFERKSRRRSKNDTIIYRTTSGRD